MAGIYLHIPFCKKACHYCDFHFSTSVNNRYEMASCLVSELKMQKDYLGKETIGSIYFGGGTPSVFSSKQIAEILDVIFNGFNVEKDAEITLEANPDDLTKEYLKELKLTHVNRLSIGIQSFFDEDLIWMNRAHTAIEGENVIKEARDAGFENITADLIYGFNLLTDEKWISNLHKMTSSGINHMSCYNLTVENGTALHNQIKKGKSKPVLDDDGARQFEIGVKFLQKNGFYQYEISNFCQDEKYSKHNTNYWKGVKYLGIGPSAHSFNGIERQWNIANNSLYMTAINQNKIPSEVEILTKNQQFNEYIMLGLRTVWGINLKEVENRFGGSFSFVLKNESEKFIDLGMIKQTDENITLTNQGKLIADQISSDLFIL